MKYKHTTLKVRLQEPAASWSPLVYKYQSLTVVENVLFASHSLVVVVLVSVAHQGSPVAL